MAQTKTDRYETIAHKSIDELGTADVMQIINSISNFIYTHSEPTGDKEKDSWKELLQGCCAPIRILSQFARQFEGYFTKLINQVDDLTIKNQMLEKKLQDTQDELDRVRTNLDHPNAECQFCKRPTTEEDFNYHGKPICFYCYTDQHLISCYQCGHVQQSNEPYWYDPYKEERWCNDCYEYYKTHPLWANGIYDDYTRWHRVANIDEETKLKASLKKPK